MNYEKCNVGNGFLVALSFLSNTATAEKNNYNLF